MQFKLFTTVIDILVGKNWENLNAIYLRSHLQILKNETNRIYSALNFQLVLANPSELPNRY